MKPQNIINWQYSRIFSVFFPSITWDASRRTKKTHMSRAVIKKQMIRGGLRKRANDAEVCNVEVTKNISFIRYLSNGKKWRRFFLLSKFLGHKIQSFYCSDQKLNKNDELCSKKNQISIPSNDRNFNVSENHGMLVKLPNQRWNDDRKKKKIKSISVDEMETNEISW